MHKSSTIQILRRRPSLPENALGAWDESFCGGKSIIHMQYTSIGTQSLYRCYRSPIPPLFSLHVGHPHVASPILALPTKKSPTTSSPNSRAHLIVRHLSTWSSPRFSPNINMAPNYTVRKVAPANTLEHRIYIEKDGVPVSPFHDIPLYANEQQTILNMVVEIPRWTNGKLEVSQSQNLHRGISPYKAARKRVTRLDLS